MKYEGRKFILRKPSYMLGPDLGCHKIPFTGRSTCKVEIGRYNIYYSIKMAFIGLVYKFKPLYSNIEKAHFQKCILAFLKMKCTVKCSVGVVCTDAVLI